MRVRIFIQKQSTKLDIFLENINKFLLISTEEIDKFLQNWETKPAKYIVGIIFTQKMSPTNEIFV